MKRKVRVRKLSICIICLVMWCLFSFSARAAEEDYIITPVINDNDYYDLTLKPSRKQTIEVEVKNNTEEDVTVYVGFYTAAEGQDGAIDYIDPEDQAENVNTLSEYITGNREIILPANKSYLFQFTVEMPADGLKSPIVGGIALIIGSEQSREGEQHKEIELLAINSDLTEQAQTIRTGLEERIQETVTTAAFSYVVPLFLKSDDSSLTPNLELKDILTEDYENNIKVVIQNATTLSADKVEVNATIRKKGKKEVFYEVRQEDVEIQANYDYEFTIPSSGKKIKAGEYTLQMELTVGDTKRQWEKSFVISEEGFVNNDQGGGEAAEPETEVIFNWWYVTIITVVCLIIAVTILSIILYRKKEREDEALIMAIKETIKLIETDI